MLEDGFSSAGLNYIPLMSDDVRYRRERYNEDSSILFVNATLRYVSRFTATHTKSDRPVQVQSSMQDHNIHMYRVFTDTEGNTEPDSQTRGLRTDSVSHVIPRGGEIYTKIIFSDDGEEMLHLLGLRWKLIFFWHSFWVPGALSVLTPPTHGLPG